MRYVLLAGGRYGNWKLPRQMIRIRGEPCISRTIRLLREAGVTDIAISTHDDRFEQFGVPLIKHSNEFTAYTKKDPADEDGCWVDAFPPMDQPACYLLGDVVFSISAIKKIVDTHTDSIQFFASAPPFSPKYIKPHAEPFGFKVVDQKRFRAAIDYVKANNHTGIFRRRPLAWELWQVINGEDVRKINFSNYVSINDYTCDIDSVEDVVRIEAQM